MKECTLSLNPYHEPLVLEGSAAIYNKIIELLLLTPGTIQTRPNMGIGLRTRYRFSEADKVDELRNDVKKQIQTYLPELLMTDVDIRTYGTTLIIMIKSDENTYGIGYKSETGEITSLNLSDL